MAKLKEERNKGGNELLEDPEAIAQQFSKTEEFVKRNRTLVFTIGGVLALAIALTFGYKLYVDNLDREAQREMFQAVYYFEAEDYATALNGDGNYYGFLEIIDKYGLTDAGNLANYYAGISFLQQGDFETAIDHLGDFKASDLLVQARAYALIGDAYMELGNYSDAAKYYQRAADHNENAFFTPVYLTKAALAFEKQDKFKDAHDCYAKIVDNYATSAEYQNARKHKARLDLLASN